MNKILKGQLLIIALVALALGSCQRKPLYLRVSQGQVDVVIYDVRLDLLWGTDWQTAWQYDWDENLYGPIGYTKPDMVKATIYNLRTAAPDTTRVNSWFRVFPAHGGRISLNTGACYDMLFFNAGTEYILLDEAPDYAYYQASTRHTDTPPSIAADTPGLKKEGSGYVGYKQPDELFGTFLHGLLVSDDPLDYEHIIDPETGQMTHIFHIQATLTPHTFIYLVQVMIINNEDDQGYIISARRTRADGETQRVGAGEMLLTNMASGVELFSRKTFHSPATLIIDADHIRPIQHRNLRLPDGTTREGDIFATRLLTWGLPDMDPQVEWERVKAGQTPTPQALTNQMVVKFYLRSGRYHPQSFDLTDQLLHHPAGGVLTIVMDASTIPPGELEPTENGGTFSATVEGWNEINADLAI